MLPSFSPTESKIVHLGSNADEDITDTVVEVVADSGSVKFIVEHSSPNPFEDTESLWTFSEGDNGRLPFGVEQSGLCLTFESIFPTKEQGGNYSISFGNFTKSFQLDVVVEGTSEEKHGYTTYYITCTLSFF